MGLQKVIRSGWVESGTVIKVGDGRKVPFWRDILSSKEPVENLFCIAINKRATVADYMDCQWGCYIGFKDLGG